MDGPSEVERVFINPTNFDRLVRTNPLTTVVELGFGTGLNFCVTVERLLKLGGNNLHFLSFEQHPLSYKDHERIQKTIAKEIPFYAELLDQLPPMLPGWHRRSFLNGRVSLSLYSGEVLTGLKEITERQKTSVDICFLDGFDPRKNPAMWTEEVFTELAKNLSRNSQASTFSAAGHVRRKLEKIGFKVERISQLPIKRESLIANFRGKILKKTFTPPKEIRILGAGIAGSTIAQHLAQQGLKVDITDPAGIARGASRIKTSLLHGRLIGDQTSNADFRVGAYHYSKDYLKKFKGFKKTGILQITGPNMSLEKMKRIQDKYNGSGEWLQLINEKRFEALSQTKINCPQALWFPDGGVVDLPDLCAELLDHPNITFENRLGNNLKSNNVVIASGHEKPANYPLAPLETYSIHGQIDSIHTPLSPAIPIVGNGYIIPIDKNHCVVGATYEYQALPTTQASNQNIDRHKVLLGTKDLQIIDSVRATRCVSSDRVPIIGALTDQIWVSIAHGSLGTSSAPLGASMIASQILGWIPPTSPEVETTTHPNRFEKRQARRGLLRPPD